MTRERIETFREIVLPFAKRKLLATHYENLSESDAKEFTRDFNEIFDLATKALEQEPRWTPTSVRAPEKNGSYLVQYCSFDGTARIRFMTVDHYSVDGHWLHEENNRKVEAWMPLPELYKGSKVGWSSLENIREKVEKEPE